MKSLSSCLLVLAPRTRYHHSSVLITQRSLDLKLQRGGEETNQDSTPWNPLHRSLHFEQHQVIQILSCKTKHMYSSICVRESAPCRIRLPSVSTWHFRWKPQARANSYRPATPSLPIPVSERQATTSAHSSYPARYCIYRVWWVGGLAGVKRFSKILKDKSDKQKRNLAHI